MDGAVLGRCQSGEFVERENWRGSERDCAGRNGEVIELGGEISDSGLKRELIW